MATEVKQEPEVTVLPEEKEDPSKQTVVLEEKPKEVPSQQKGESDKQYLQRLQHLENQLAGARRINESLQQKMRELEQRVSASASVAETTVSASGDKELDELANQGRWQEWSALIGRREAEKVLQGWQVQEQMKQQQVQAEQTLVQSKQQVTSRYPQLDEANGDEDDPFSQVYSEVVNTHPEWHKNPYGPTLAMAAAEDLARERGIKLQPAKPAQKLAADAEMVRRNRVSSSALPPSRSDLSTGKYVMTQEEYNFCKTNGIDPKKYLGSKQTLEKGGVVEA